MYQKTNTMSTKSGYFQVRIMQHTPLTFANKKEDMWHKEFVGERILVKEMPHTSAWYECKNGASILKADCARIVADVNEKRRWHSLNWNKYRNHISFLFSGVTEDLKKKFPNIEFKKQTYEVIYNRKKCHRIDYMMNDEKGSLIVGQKNGGFYVETIIVNNNR